MMSLGDRLNRFARNRRRMGRVAFGLLVAVCFIVIALAITGCSDPMFYEKWTRWEVKQGKKTFQRKGGLLGFRNITVENDGVFRYRAKLHPSCLYTMDDPLDVRDINKLPGSSDRWAKHRKHGVYIGWRVEDNGATGKFEILGYWHNGNDPPPDEYPVLAVVEPLEEFRALVNIIQEDYTIWVNDTVIEVPRAKSADSGPHYLIQPHFSAGGDGAPHDMAMELYFY